MQEQIRRRLQEASPEEILELMKQLGKLNEFKKTINIKLGRLKK